MNTTQDIPRFCTAYELDQRIHRLAALCKQFGIEGDRLERYESVKLEAHQKRVESVFKALKERVTLWQLATGRTWLANGFEGGSIFFEEGVLRGAYMADSDLKPLLKAHRDGLTVDSMILRRERTASRMSARWQMAVQ